MTIDQYCSKKIYNLFYNDILPLPSFELIVRRKLHIKLLQLNEKAKDLCEMKFAFVMLWNFGSITQLIVVSQYM